MTLPPLRERTIGEYLDRLGTSHPDPGGGSVAGLIGALAAGLGQMVISLTRDKSELEPVHAALQASIATLLKASADDERAYAGYVTASRLPKSTSEEKQHRKEAMQAALVTSAEVPLGLATSANQVLSLLDPVARTGTDHAFSDAEIAIGLAESAVLAALMNVRVNVPYIKDTDRAGRFASESDRLEADARAQVSKLRETLAERRAG